MTDPNETADLVAGITRAYREHAAAAEPQDDEADEAEAAEVLEDDPDCE